MYIYLNYLNSLRYECSVTNALGTATQSSTLEVIPFNNAINRNPGSNQNKTNYNLVIIIIGIVCIMMLTLIFIVCFVIRNQKAQR